MLSRIAEVEPQFYRNIARQKMAYAWHIFRGSSGINALLILEGKISGVKREVDQEEHGLVILQSRQS